MSRSGLRVRASFGSFQISQVQNIRVAGEVQRRGLVLVYHVQPSEAVGIGRGACVIGARLGAVICIGSVGFDLAPRFASVWSRCAVLPRSPMASTCSRLRLYSI